MHNIWQDVRHAARTLRASPLFALVSVLSLAIGISGTAIVFNIADAYLFQPRSGMRDVSRLVEVGRTDSTVGSGRYGGGDFDTFSYPNYLDYGERQTSFDGLAAIRVNATFGLGAEGSSPVRVTGAFVSANYFSVLGVAMQLGRPFRPDEEAVSSPVTVAVLSDRLWRTSFGGDPSVVGRTIRVNGRPFTVIGVTTPSFSGHSLEVLDMEAFTLFPQRLASWMTGAMAVVGLFLATLGLYGLIAFDVGQRTREIGIRVALGALRSQVVAAVVAAAGLLAGVGTAIGLAAAALSTGLLTGMLYGVQPLDPLSFGGAAALLAVIAVVASVAPARRAASVNPADALRAE